MLNNGALVLTLKTLETETLLPEYKETVPDTPGASTLVNYEEGYTPEYELAPDTDPNGNYVGRQRMNQLFNDITTNLKYWQDNSFPEFVANDGTGNPVSYPINAIVRFSGVNYIAVVDGTNTTDPSASTEFIPWHLGITAFVGSNTAINTNIDKTTLQDYNDGAGNAFFDTIINAGGADESLVRWLRKTSGSTSTIKLGELTNPDNVEGNSVLSILGTIFAGPAGDQQLLSTDDLVGSITSNGYITIPASDGNDLILQWGTTAQSGGSTTTITYPIVFPNAVFNVTPMFVYNNTSIQTYRHVVSQGTANASVATFGSVVGFLNWFAIGN
jgi:hypothetical protein